MNGLDLLTSDFGTEFWDMASIPFAGILGHPEWETSQYVSNSIDMANPLWGFWPPSSGVELTGPEAVTSSSSAPISSIMNATLPAEGSNFSRIITEPTLSRPSLAQEDNLLRSVCDVLRASPWKEIPVKDLPSTQHIERYIDHYFTKFHIVS